MTRLIVALLLLTGVTLTGVDMNASRSTTVLDLQAASFSNESTHLFESGMFYQPRTQGSIDLYEDTPLDRQMVRWSIGFSGGAHGSETGGGTVQAFHDAIRATANMTPNTWAHNNHDKIVLPIETMPAWLSACTGDTCDDYLPGEFYWTYANTYGASDWETWELLVEDFVTFWAVEMPLVTGKNPQLYFEMWNEPDGDYWTPDTATFLTMYAHTAEAIKRIAPTAKIGGPTVNQWAATISGATPAYIELINYAKANSVPLDFLVWHMFTFDSASINTIAAAYRAACASAGLKPEPELLITEWNANSAYRGSRLHTAVFAGYYLAMYQAKLAGHTFAVWEDWEPDVLNELGLLFQCGATCDAGDKKGIYHAYISFGELAHDSLGLIHRASAPAAPYEGQRQLFVSKKSETSYTVIAWETGFDPPTAAGILTMEANGLPYATAGALCVTMWQLEDAIWNDMACGSLDPGQQAAFHAAHLTWETNVPLLRPAVLSFPGASAISVTKAVAAKTGTRNLTATVNGNSVSFDLAKQEVAQLDLSITW